MTEDCLSPAQVHALSLKADELTRWLAQYAPNCQTSQKHLEDGTIEQVYWHYGYLCALRDVLPMLELEKC